MLLLNCGFPQAKTLPAELNVRFTSPREVRRASRRLLFWGPWFGLFRLGNRAAAQRRVLRAHVRARSGHERTRKRPKVAKSSPKPRFGCPRATLLAQICEHGDIERTLLFIMF